MGASCVVLLAFLLLPAHVSSQGLRLPINMNRAGASQKLAGSQSADARASSDAALGSARVLMNDWSTIQGRAAAAWGPARWLALRRSSSCTQREKGSLCGVDLSAMDSRAALLVAASPAAYDTRVAGDNGGFVAAPAPRNQYECNACVGMAVSAAADVAVAKALFKALTGPTYSARHLFFCNAPAGPRAIPPSCASGWAMQAALVTLARNGPRVPVEQCLPFVEKLSDIPEDCEYMCTLTAQRHLLAVHVIHPDA